MRSIVVASVVVVILALAAPANSQQAVDFRGRVFDADTKRGIENLEVKLTPPRGVKAPIRVVSTDRNGAFLFQRLVGGKYLVEVSQGVNLLYRSEVDTSSTNQLSVPLRPKR
jgi:hypothetical protein